MPADTPDDVRRLLTEGGFADDDLLRRAIAVQAQLVGFTFDEAVELEREGRLPKDGPGSLLEMLIEMLYAPV
jgi:hypothetical protein